MSVRLIAEGHSVKKRAWPVAMGHPKPESAWS